jgi:predicted GNAT family N-acyltransferase
MSLIIETLNSQHKKSGFDCGNELLNNYIQKQAKQDVSRDLSACYILNNPEDKIVVGYYTLSGSSIKKNDFPEDLILKLPPSYVDLPTVLLGRLAIDNLEKGKGFGEILLIDALKRCVEISNSLGVLAVIVDPIDEKAVTFYKSYGFILIPSNNKMFIPIKTIQNSL